MTKVVVDLEATCWDTDREKQRRESETIEIGAVFTDDNFEPIGEFQTFIKPVRNPILSPFCTSLTSISQSDVDRAPPFPEAMLLFEAAAERIAEKSLVKIMFCSWGAYDGKQLEKDATYHKSPCILGAQRNIKTDFADHFGCKPCGLRRALEKMQISFAGTHHRGIDDARNIQILAKLLRGGTLVPRQQQRARS